MYLSLKSSKHLILSSLRQANRFLPVSSTLPAAQSTQPAMGFFSVNKSQESSSLFLHSKRMFSNYPDHSKLEMPNLSPTMEKVPLFWRNNTFLG